MTDLSLATRPDADAGPAPAGVPSRGRDVFVPADIRRPGAIAALRRRLHWPLGVYTTPVAILVVWEILGLAGVIPPLYAPAPTDIAATAVELWRDGTLGPDLAISLQRAGLGLALGLSIGIVTGVLGGFLRRGEYLFNGVAQILNTIPLLAVLPLMIVWFGIDELTKVLLIAFGAGVPMYLNLFAAIRGVDQRLIEMARTTGAGRRRIVGWVLLPGALPGFLVGVRFSLAYSVLGLVAAETVNADSGLGFLVTQAQTYLQTNQVFVGLVIYSVLGLLADQIVRILERVLLRWRPSYEAT
ncbi:sulfonate ABC transporter permease [Mycolicibacterium madagascariense]|uniref:Sulfonate ABC transporter permease n=1 Tax=Mycolicibacterium madagascariense TaxID=212765 RepID=A0A7I7XGA1_9MYCO|nr:ABC transporter permease [Mycolicibacterium madagascariense]MCV7016072.1 ABC transporter permease [Mycolicibacterium madagascariense]BBZ28145.1 sulfonate ABC transporter permease [Mycolicibacterium madagascariense]